MRWLRCCLNPKVIAGLAAVGVVVWLVAPSAGAAALPLLIGLVCPLSMGVMAWRMGRQRSGGTPGPATHLAPADAATGEDVDAEIRALREEVAVERARRSLAARNNQQAT